MNRFGRFSLALEHGRKKTFVVEALAKELPRKWIADALARTGKQSRRESRLPAFFVVWFIILMALYRRTSYINLLEKLHDTWWTRRRWKRNATPCSSAVTKARDRLGVEPMKMLFEHSARKWIDGTDGLIIGGRRVFALDGTTMKVPDSEINSALFGRPGASRGTTAYPQLRVVALMDVGTHLIQAERHGPYKTAEINLARDLIEEVPADSIVLCDRGFAAYDFLWAVAERRHADFVVRIKDNIKTRLVRRLGPGDAIVEITTTKKARREHPELPKRWMLREITYRMRGRGKNIRLLTTLLDPDTFSWERLARLYHDRWEEETAFDEIKTHQCQCATVNRPVVFRSKTPSRVEQELFGMLIAFNVVRKTMATAVTTVDISPRRLSFTAALERVREASESMMNLHPVLLARRYKKMLAAIARAVVPKRPGRQNPREVKIKMSSYPVKKSRHAA